MKQITFLMMIFATFPAAAAEPEAPLSDPAKYQHCLTLVGRDPVAALAYANDWIFGGVGDVPAGHCKALALLESGKPVAAAELLEKLIDDLMVNGDPTVRQNNDNLRVQLSIQAALAWKAAGATAPTYYDKAYVAYSDALSGIKTDNPLLNNKVLLWELYVERGTLQILRGESRAAIGDFTQAIVQDDQQYEAYLQRAKAYRKTRNFLKARLDLKVADKLGGEIPEARGEILLESGILFREQGRKLEARQAWQAIIDTYPTQDVAEMARTNIALLPVE
ncbi:tetratricopeptide repeat protein [Paremcibacter congregatus]|uniref:tetratricopeptide repeat protein n=1 Tax=Paremcibacter congregatus TaxID=2043170 RepID=UPI0030ED7716|tara:strand:- start:9499 stop:10332 length:834 start_codon:yes stop_codon:yes gene_type:complete